MSAYQTLIQLIADGMAVNASTANTPLTELQGNVDYLKEILETALLGSTVIARERTLDASVLPGQAVFYNDTTERFEQALPRIDTDDNGELTTAKSTYVLGIVYRKLSANQGDVLLRGLAPVNLSDAITGTITPGLYYLSTTEAGKLTKQPQAVSVPVCQVLNQYDDTSWEVLVNSNFEDLLNAHKHYRFELTCEEAADSTHAGWLPANNAVFAGHAPAGAVYGYNLSVDNVGNFWPPLPIESAYLEWHQTGSPTVLGQGVPEGDTTASLVKFDINGIWWMSSCSGQEPFPAEGYTPSDDCPHVPPMRMILWFSRPIFWTSNTAVLSLEPVTGSGLVVTCTTTGQNATTGHLQIGLDLNLAVNSTVQTGHLVVKDFTGGKFNKGPVVEAIKAGSANVTLTSSLGVLPGSGNAQGIVTIAVDSSLNGTELPIETVRLDGATEEFHDNIIALGFAAGYPSSYNGRFYIPKHLTLPAGTQAKLKFRLLGRAAGTINSGAFTLTYRRITAPSSLGTLVSLPTTDTSLTFNPGAVLSATDQYYEVESSAFDVAAGDVVIFSMTRLGVSPDAYTAQIQVLQQLGVLVVSE